jgi:2-(1,2-epoxy-1,2-dihydrophenyl)acetyl-CoA isomerase
LKVEVRDGIGILSLNRPEHLNAVTPHMAEAMADTALAFERDSSVRAVLVRGEGRSFCAGADVRGFHEALTQDRDAHARSMERRVVTGHLTFLRLRRMPKPVVVAVHGDTAGMGVSLMCCGDLVIAAQGAQFTLAYRHVGLSLDGGVSFFLPRIVGERRALEIALLGERFGVDQGVAWGLINRVVPDADLRSGGESLAARLASGPTRALGEIKRLLRASLQSSWDEQSAREAESIAMMVASDDHLEGVNAFIEKRRPAFKGA